MNFLKRSILGCAILAATAASSLTWANDYKYFSIDLPSTWKEFTPEQTAPDGSLQVVFMSKNLQNMMTITSVPVDTDTDLNAEEQMDAYKAIVEGLKENSLKVKSEKYLEDEGYFLVKGILMGQDIEARMFGEGKVVFLALGMGAKQKDGFDALKTIKIKQ